MKLANKKQNNFNIYNVEFKKKKIKKNTCRYYYQNLDDMIYSSWNIEQNILKLVILGHFLPIYPKNKNFEKWKNLLEISSFYSCVPKITIIWCTVPEIRSESDRIFLSFWVIFCFFFHPHPFWFQKSKFWKKEKKIGDIIILHMCTINDNKWQSYEVWFLRYGV